MSPSKLIIKIEKTATEIEGYFTESLKNLSRVESTALLKIIDSKPSVQSSLFQLLLQYRLDTQDVLVQIMRIDQTVLDVLKLDKLSSYAVNLNTLTYALGRDDISQLIAALSQILDKLHQLAYKFKDQKHNVKKENSKTSDEHPIKLLQENLAYAIQSQKKAHSALEKLQIDLHALVELEAIGPVLDHISALAGPISRFHQCLQNGIEHSSLLLKEFFSLAQKDNPLNLILGQTNELLNQIAHKNHGPSLFHTNQPKLPIDELEQRAMKRRMGQFFSH